MTDAQGTASPDPAPDLVPDPLPGRLDAVAERIGEAKDAEAVLHDQDALGDVDGGAGQVGGGTPVQDDGHGAFEPSGDDRQAGQDPGEGADAGTAAGSPGQEHREEPDSVEQFDGPGPNPL